MDIYDLENRFAYHTPKDEKTGLTHGDVRAKCLNLAVQLNELVPEGREKSLAITHLEEVMMWANAGIARAK
jgi:hypothetical protein